MHGLRSLRFGLGLAAFCGGIAPPLVLAQDPPALEAPITSPTVPSSEVNPPVQVVDNSLPQIPALPPVDNRLVKPAAEGPLHEAFLSPAKDKAPNYVDKAPPNPLNERPGVDPPE